MLKTIFSRVLDNISHFCKEDCKLGSDGTTPSRIVQKVPIVGSVGTCFMTRSSRDESTYHF